jgi:Ner family transcriptional regulator
MPRPRPDWHPEDVKAALKKQGITFKGLSLEHGFHESMVRRVIHDGRSATVQAIIANLLRMKPQAIWPSRYNADGTPRRRNQRRGEPPAAQRQIREAA